LTTTGAESPRDRLVSSAHPKSDQSVDHVAVRKARIGRGLFATRAFRAGETIMHITGRVYDADVLWERGGTFADNCYRFGPETYLDPGDAPGRFVNHSCEPNAGVRKKNNRLFLVAADAIRRGDELTFDYSTILGDDDIWTMRCRCGTRSCRRTIQRVGLLPAEVYVRYVDLGIIPGYVLQTLGQVPGRDF
jgi:hypothetical protein